MSTLSTMFSDLRKIVSSVVVKYNKYAKQYETVDSIRESDRYMSAIRQMDSWNTYQTFDPEAIIRAGLAFDMTMASKLATDKSLIPDNKRDVVVRAQRQFIIETYNEKNNYYRMLNGLPDIEETTFIYIDPVISEEQGLDPNKPIHEFSDEEILKIEKIGLLEKIKMDNPTKKYLNFLGQKRIPIKDARQAKAFSILYMDKEISEELHEKVILTYEQSREYFMSVIYVSDFGTRYDLYDNFIAMNIMIMTIQRVLVNTFKSGIQRDFYDLATIQMLFESYHVPFIESIPMEYQRALAQNLNNLLYYKSTDKVLYDICSILGFERIKIYKYYLIKDHKLDTNENPIFVYKEVQNEDGTTSLVEDPEQMYELYFQTVDIQERNLALALSNNLNRLDYNQVVFDDPYWWNDDEELKKTLYESEYNYVESKYLNMNIMYKLTDMLFEVIYIFRLLLDKKSEVQPITVELPRLFVNKEVDLFDLTVFLCALISKKNKLMGDIISTPTKALTVMGFNFKAELPKIRQYIRSNAHLIDQQVLNFIDYMNINSAQDINTLFLKIKGFRDFVTERLASTQNIEEYRAYKKIYNALMVTEETGELFKKSDGTVATTFLDYLQDKDIALATYVENATEEDMNKAIEHSLFRLNELVKDLKYLYILNDSNNVMLNAVITLIRFFKSYTVDLSSFNITYLMNSRHYNMIKLITDFHRIQANVGLDDDAFPLQYNDHILYNSMIHGNKDLITFVNKYALFSSISKEDKEELQDEISKVRAEIDHKIKQTLYDRFDFMKTNLNHSDLEFQTIEEFLDIYASMPVKEKQDLFEKFNQIARMLYKARSLSPYSDVLLLSSFIQTESDILEFQETKSYLSTINEGELAELYDRFIEMVANIYEKDYSQLGNKEQLILMGRMLLDKEKMTVYERKLTFAGLILSKENPMEFINSIEFVSSNLTINDKVIQPYTDFLSTVSKMIYQKTDLNTLVKTHIITSQLLYDFFTVDDKLRAITSNIYVDNEKVITEYNTSMKLEGEIVNSNNIVFTGKEMVNQTNMNITSHVNSSNTISGMSKFLDLYLSILDDYADVIDVINTKTQHKEYFPMSITDKLELIWEV